MRIAALLLALIPAAAAAQASAPLPAEVRVAFTRDRITAIHAAGLADRTKGRAVTADDPVRVASISKLVVGLGVMRLVEAGVLDLDRDVSDYLGWPLRNPAYPDAPITLRLLLSHRSSLTDGVDYVVPVGRHIRDVLADQKAWDADHAPGSYFRYANIGFPVIATVIEKATGERFDRVMQAQVFRPLKLDACYNWSGCSERAVRHAVVLYRSTGEVAKDDLHWRRPPCPIGPAPCDLAAYRPGDNGALFSPQGGLNISMRSLARIGQLLLRGGERFLRPSSIALLTTPAWTFDGANGDSWDGEICRYGLATVTTATPGCRDDPFGDGRARVGHLGDAYGLKSGLWIDRVAGTGVAYFVTAVSPDSQGRSRYTAEEERLARGE